MPLQYSIRRSSLVQGSTTPSDEQMIIGLDSALNEWLAAIPPERTHSLTLRSCSRLRNITIFYFQLNGTPQTREMIRGLACCCSYAITIYKCLSTDLSFRQLRRIVVSQHFYQPQAWKLTNLTAISYTSLAICTTAARSIARIVANPAVVRTYQRPLWIAQVPFLLSICHDVR